MTELLLSLVPTIIMAIVAGLTKLAFADRDRRIADLERDVEMLAKRVAQIEIGQAIGKTQNEALLRAAENTEKKLDTLLWDNQ